MKNIFLILVTFFTFNICFASFPVNNISDHLHNQEISISNHEIIETSNDPILIVVLALIGLIGWLYSKSSKTARTIATILSVLLVILLIALAIFFTLAIVSIVQWFNSN